MSSPRSRGAKKNSARQLGNKKFQGITQRERFELIHSIITAPDNKLQVNWLCDAAGVSRSGYYKWLQETDKRREKEAKDRQDFDLILEAYKFRGVDKGVKGIHMRLLHMDPPVLMNIKKIRRLMRKYGLVCPIRKPNPYRTLMRKLSDEKVADNLLNRNFHDFAPREAFTTDITYIHYSNGAGLCYLSVIRDSCTHEVLAYELSISMAEDFVLKTVNSLISRYGAEIKKQAILHSDQGIHYRCISFKQILKDEGLRQSMSRKANCWDNAPQESFFGHMKDEIGNKIRQSKTFNDVKEVISDHMNYYNEDRGQWSLAKLTPKEYYQYRITGVYPLITANDPKQKR